MTTTIKTSKRQQLTLFERIRIETLYKEKYISSQIAKILCRHRSIINREVMFVMLKLRNSDWSEREEYSAYYAEIKHNEAKSKTGGNHCI